jgi:hypothetical protein
LEIFNKPLIIFLAQKLAIKKISPFFITKSLFITDNQLQNQKAVVISTHFSCILTARTGDIADQTSRKKFYAILSD